MTVLFTDMKGYTSMTSSLSHKEISYLLATQRSIVSTLVKQWKGSIIKNLGDGYMATFDSPTNAVSCGLKIQHAVRTYNRTAKTRPFELRIAVNSGEMILKDGDIFGDPVNIAARVLSLTPPGEVYFTEPVFLSMNKSEVLSVKVGVKTVKGVVEPIMVYQAVKDAFEASPLRQVFRRFVHSFSVIGSRWKQRSQSKSVLSSRNLKYGLLGAAMLFVVGMTFPKESAQLARTVKDDVKGIETDIRRLATHSASLTNTPTSSSTFALTPTATPSATIRPATPTPTPTRSKKQSKREERED